VARQTGGESGFDLGQRIQTRPQLCGAEAHSYRSGCVGGMGTT
jgi:hypothetical protein